MKTKFFALTLVFSIATSMSAFAGAGHEHDREGPQSPRRQLQNAEKSAKSESSVAETKKDGRDIGSVSEADQGQGQNLLQAQKIEEQPKVAEKNESSSESEEKPRRRPLHHTGMLGM